MNSDKARIKGNCRRWGLVVMLVLTILLAGCAAPLSIATVRDKALPISRSEVLNVDGAHLYLLARGTDRQAPILLWLHGGPGGAERPLFRYFNHDLEDHFLVVYWDQRGTGRSHDPDGDPQVLTVARHLADLDAVVDHLCKDFAREKVVLLGHSWGAALGVLYSQKHPDKVAAFIGVGPVVSFRRQQEAEYAFVKSEASRRDDREVLARLAELGPPPSQSVEKLFEMEALCDRYGGDYHLEPCKSCVVVTGLLTGLVTPFEIYRIHQGIHSSLAAMNAELLHFDLAREVPQVEVPVWFFLGRYDRHAEAKLAARYFETLVAPGKKLVWFENSAHNIPFEEPELFDTEVVKVLAALGGGTTAPAGDNDKMIGKNTMTSRR